MMKNLKLKWVALFIFCALYATATFGKNTPSASFSGKLPDPNDELIYAYLPDLYTNPSAEYYFNNKPDASGSFRFNLNKAGGRISNLVLRQSGITILKDYVPVEAGDQISILFEENDRGEEKIRFEGKGAAKYNCSYRINQVQLPNIVVIDDRKATIQQKQNALDKYQHEMLDILDQYRGQISTSIIELFKADIFGKVGTQRIFLFHCINPRQDGNPIKIEEEATLRRFLQKKDNIRDEAAAQSFHYLNYLKMRILTVNTLENKGGQPGLPQVYQYTQNTYKGTLRDALLLNLYTENSYWFRYYSRGIDPTFFAKAINTTAKATKQLSLKRELNAIAAKQIKGVEAFNFRLPADSSGKIVTLKDLRGKVVLLDIWGYMCTGCYRFSEIFHSQIYPELRNDSNFAMVSIMSDDQVGMDKYMRRLRNLPDTIGTTILHHSYTHPEYINLYGGIGEVSAREMEKHYKISGGPCVMLIDKKGKIYSTTLPLFTDDDSVNIEALRKLIRQVLKENS